jgi:hypothetical protein
VTCLSLAARRSPLDMIPYRCPTPTTLSAFVSPFLSSLLARIEIGLESERRGKDNEYKIMSRIFHHRVSVRTPSLLLRASPSRSTAGIAGVPPPCFAAAISAAASAGPSALLHRYNQVANHWQAVIRRNKTDPRTGEPTFQDWDEIIDGFQSPTLTTTGQSLLERHLRAERHIKPKEVRRQINSAKIYKRSVKRVDDLVSYIQFMQKKKKEEDVDDF